MKKISMLLVMALLLSLCACGREASVVSSGEPAVSAAEMIEATAPVEVSETPGGYIVPASWTENSINDGTWGYVTAAADLPEGDYSIRQDKLILCRLYYERSKITLTT